MSTSSYLCLHVSVCARRGVETNPLRDIICYQRQRYLYPGFSPPARSISLQPPSRSISFSISHFITLSYPFFSPASLPFHPDTLHALCVPFDKRPIPGTERSDICPPDPLPVNHAATFRAGEHMAVFEALSVPDCSSIYLSKQN